MPRLRLGASRCGRTLLLLACALALTAAASASTAGVSTAPDPAPQPLFRPPVDAIQIVCVFDDLNCATQTLYHAAIDFGGSTGDPVYATADGVVTKIVPDDGTHDHGFGNTVILRHQLANGDTIYSLYAHLDSVDAATTVGACLPRGTELGTLGGSGDGDEHHWAPHVHFELKLKGELRNPLGPGPWWGYLPGPAEDYGYFDPAAYVDRVAASPQCSPAPAPPGSVKQLDGATGSQLSFGATASSTSVVATAKVKGETGPLWLLVEARPVGVAFTGEPICSSGDGVSPGHKATARCDGLDSGSYHWQARVEDATGALGPWVRPGGNPETSPDFTIPDRTPPAVTIDSVDPTTAGADGTSTVTWRADENGSYAIVVDGADCSSGETVASGTYAGAPGDSTAQVDASTLAEGQNTVLVCVTDAAGNTGSASTVITKDSG